MYAADKYSGTPAAQAEYKKAEKARESGDFDTAAADYQKAIDLDHNFAKAYSDLLFARTLQMYLGSQGKGKSNEEKAALLKKSHDETVAKYTTLASQHPDNPVYPWVVAQLYNESDPDLQEKYCRQSVKISEDFTPGYECLATVAMLRGDSVHGAEYFRRVLAANPDSPDVALQYMYYVHADPKEYKAAALEVGKKFPNSQQAAQALYRYAMAETDRDERVKDLKQLLAKYSPAKFDSASDAADDLFAYYDQTDPAKARRLAQKMLEQMPASKTWKADVAYSDAMVEAKRKIDAHDGAGALAILGKVKTPGYVFSKVRLNLLTAEAKEISAGPAESYVFLLKDVAAFPSDREILALYASGKKLGKNREQVDAELWGARSAASTPAIPFSLESFTTGKKVSLDDYKGHVVIVDFWYPNCGPCMASFPYLHGILEKFKDQGVVLLAINGIEGQAPFVLPLLKSKGLDDFIPLRGNEKWCSDVYHVRGFPTTFFIGADGRVYFKTHVYSPETQSMAELQIEALLRAQQEGKSSQSGGQ